MATAEMVMRLFAAVFLAALLGLNRYVHRKYIGVRTLAIVSLSGAALTIFASELLTSEGVSRVLQGLLTGIGFIGAGVIVHGRSGHGVRGLTSAAVVFLCVTVGILCGLGPWELVAAVAAISVIILAFGGPAERYIGARLSSHRRGRPDLDEAEED